VPDPKILNELFSQDEYKNAHSVVNLAKKLYYPDLGGECYQVENMIYKEKFIVLFDKLNDKFQFRVIYSIVHKRYYIYWSRFLITPTGLMCPPHYQGIARCFVYNMLCLKRSKAQEYQSKIVKIFMDSIPYISL
jgi:hypothetical protein